MTDAKQYQPIACGDYDYLEVACLYQYKVELVLPADKIRGKAITTEKNDSGEFLTIETGDGQQRSVRADQIEKMIVLTENARFAEHTFALGR